MSIRNWSECTLSQKNLHSVHFFVLSGSQFFLLFTFLPRKYRKPVIFRTNTLLIFFSAIDIFGVLLYN